VRQVVNLIVARLPTSTVKSISALQWRARWLRNAFLRVGKSYSNHDGIIQRGPAQGLKFNPGNAHYAGFLLGTYEPEVQKVFTSLIKPGMTVYDVGANVGFLAVLAARLVGPGGHVICFEPLAVNIEAIRHNAAINSFANISIVPEALGTEDGVAEFLLFDDVGWGRLSDSGAPGLSSGSLTIPVRSLTTAIDEHHLPSPDVIKVDIEGGEIGMLEGSRNVLSRCRPVLLIELHGTNEPVDAILREQKYSAYLLGESRPMAQAPWDAFAIGVPSEDRARCELAGQIARQALLTR
jgi:FkbM family methyltransferase